MTEDLENDPRVTWTTDVLRFRDMDKFGHVNNAVFATLCESGRVDFSARRLGATLPPDAYWVIVRLTIEFRAELHYPGEVRTGTWPTRLGRSSVIYGHVLLSNGTQAATAESVCVLMDGATRRSMPLPDPARRIVEELLCPPAKDGG